MARALAPRNRWLTWGAWAGTLYGAGYAWLGSRLIGAPLSPTIVLISMGLGAGAGAAFAFRYHAGRPAETSLCTWLGMLLGSIPAVGALLLMLFAEGPSGTLGLHALAAFAYVPVLVGLFVGGLLDRLSEGFLFMDEPDIGPAP